MVRSECLYARSDRSGRLWKDIIGQRVRAKYSKLEETSQVLFLQIHLCPFLFQDKDALFLWI